MRTLEKREGGEPVIKSIDLFLSLKGSHFRGSISNRLVGSLNRILRIYLCIQVGANVATARMYEERKASKDVRHTAHVYIYKFRMSKLRLPPVRTQHCP